MVGPLVWGAIAGAPGVVAYRIVNTLDAMVGHHSERYERFGYAAARIDDLAGLLPARLTAALAALLAPVVDGSTAGSWRAWRRDAAEHPSPNAGPCEAAFAGALGIRLGGPTVYPYGLSARPWQGDGRDPDAADVVRAAPAVPRRDARGGCGLCAAGDRARCALSAGFMSGALLVAGTTSDAGKSVLTAGLCRWLARQGVKVAPFKAQNMSLNSMVTADGGEIGRAQAMQAAAAGVPAEAAMNPILLKPGSDRHSHVVVLGRPYADADARSYRQLKGALLGGRHRCAGRAARPLRRRHLRGRRQSRRGQPARAATSPTWGSRALPTCPCIVVGDIDRGGVLAHFAGTLGVLEPADQRHIAGFVVNKFRGDPALLTPGLDWLRGHYGTADFRRPSLARRALARRRGLPRSRAPPDRRRRARSATTCCASRSSGCRACRT